MAKTTIWAVDVWQEPEYGPPIATKSRAVIGLSRGGPEVPPRNYTATKASVTRMAQVINDLRQRGKATVKVWESGPVGWAAVLPKKFKEIYG